MNAQLNYFIEANLGLLFFLGVYGLLLRNETDFRFKRVFMLLAIAASLLLPLLHIRTQEAIVSLSGIIPVYWLPEIVINGDASGGQVPASPSINTWLYIEIIYGIGVFLFLTAFIVQITKVVTLVYKSQRHRVGKLEVIESDKSGAAFSFFRFVFIGNSGQLTEKEKQLIIRHETVHVQRYHFIDLLLTNLLGIFFWFNPAIRTYRKIFIHLHEFEADSRAVESHEVKEYCGLLARAALQSADFSFANYFKSSLTIKRIEMIQTVKSKIGRWKIAAIVPFVAALFFFIACQDQVLEDVKAVAKNSTTTVDFPAEVQNALDKLKSEHPDRDYIVVEMNEDGRRTLDKMGFEDAETGKKFSSMTLIKTDAHSEGEGRSFMILEKGNDANMLAKMTATPDEVFTIVEESAQPKNGMAEFYRLIGEKLTYPLKARQMGIEGRVFVEFIVNKDGTLSDIRPVKGIGGGCDEEAVNVVALSPPWEPARQKGIIVKQRMVLPITFKLAGSSKTFGYQKRTDKTLDEIVVAGVPKKEN